MAGIITEPCIGTKGTFCVDTCPVDCIASQMNEEGFEEAKQLYIHSEECRK